MIAKVFPSRLSGRIEAVPSKSAANRLIIAAALSDKPCKIGLSQMSDDLRAAVSAVTAMGAETEYNGGILTVKPVWDGIKRNSVYNAGESGSVLRFLLPVVCALGTEGGFIGGGRLPSRPMSELINCLSEHSVSITPSVPYTVKGKLTSGIYRITGGVSSQFVTGLLLALPLLEGGSEIIIEGGLASKPYVDITLDILERFKIEIIRTENGFYVNGGQKYISPLEIKTEGDWSNAAFWLASGAINGDITVSGLDLNSKQGDRRVTEILKAFGADITINADGIRVKKSALRATVIDARDIPDLIPVLSVLAAYAEGTTIIKNAERLRDKESDRLQAVINLINGLNGGCGYSDGLLKIHGGGGLFGGFADGCNDHRMVMSAAVAALRAEAPVEISGIDAVNKSYPAFFNDYRTLGGEVCSKK